MVLAVAAAASFAAGDAAPDKPDPQAVSESFAKLTFDFCAAVVARSDATVADIGRGLTGFRWDGPKSLSETGTWSEPLQSRLRAKPDTQVYKAITDLSSVEAFHLAYARVDGESCVVIAQGIPDVTALTASRLAADKSFHLITENEQRRVFGRPGENGESGFIVAVPADTRVGGVVDVVLFRQEVPRPATDAALDEWLGAVIAGCRASIDQRRPITAADFDSFLKEEVGRNGSVTLQSLEQYPPAFLFKKPAPKFGCEFLLYEGEAGNERVVAALLARLAVARVPRRPGSKGEERYLVKFVADGGRAMELRIRPAGTMTMLVLEGR